MQSPALAEVVLIPMHTPGRCHWSLVVVYFRTRKVVHYDSLFTPAALPEGDGKAWLHGEDVGVPNISCADAETGVRMKVTYARAQLMRVSTPGH